MKRKARRDLRNGLLFISPWLIGISIFLVYPIFLSVYYSFTRFPLLSPPSWIGWSNYLELFQDKVFWTVLYNTLFYFSLQVPLIFIVALSAALLLNTKVRGMALFRTFFYLPSLVPIVATAILWAWVFNARYGLLNAALSIFGIKGITWLNDPAYVKPSLVLMSLWGMGEPMVIYLAALQGVPVNLYESSFLDGANWWQRIYHITIPLISPAIFFNVVRWVMGAFILFTQPYIMTGGGPGRASEFYVTYLWENAFDFLKMGYASAMAWILFIIIFAVTLVVFKFGAKKVYYEGA